MTLLKLPFVQFSWGSHRNFLREKNQCHPSWTWSPRKQHPSEWAHGITFLRLAPDLLSDSLRLGLGLGCKLQVYQEILLYTQMRATHQRVTSLGWEVTQGHNPATWSQISPRPCFIFLLSTYHSAIQHRMYIVYLFILFII